MAIVSKSFEGKTDRTEEWYGTQYRQEAIPAEVIKVELPVHEGARCVSGSGTGGPGSARSQPRARRAVALSVPSQEESTGSKRAGA